ILKSLVFSLSTTVRGTRDSLREADQTFSVRLHIVGAVSDNGTSCSKVSSAEIDLGGLFGTTWLLLFTYDRVGYGRRGCCPGRPVPSRTRNRPLASAHDGLLPVLRELDARWQ